MRPTNTPERNAAFLNFLFFFTATVGLLLLIVVFSLKMPDQENKMLRQRLSTFENDKVIIQGLQAEMAEVNKLLKSRDPNVPIAYISSDVTTRLTRMQRFADSLSGGSKGFYRDVVASLADYLEQKRQLQAELDRPNMPQAGVPGQIGYQ